MSIRPRRLRRTSAIRALASETRLDPSCLIMPIFVKEGIEGPEEIKSMPGQFRWPVNDKLVKFAEELLQYGIRSVLLFGVTSKKDDFGLTALDKNGIVPRAIRLLKETFGDRLVVMADVCLCPYTTHGHCGIVKWREGSYVIDNDETIRLYAKMAVNFAEAGADCVAPSGMMDGQVRAIREALDEAGFKDVLIMSYSAKYASSLYGPFRDAADSAPKFGDRRSYQMDPRNAYEALKEVELDVEEGADIVMVKPALFYLDVIKLVKDAFPEVPLAAYQVSGEYVMIKELAARGLANEDRLILESLIAIRRAGADMIITYFAKEAARLSDKIDELF